MAESILQYMLCKQKQINEEKSQRKESAKTIPLQYAPESPSLQVDGGATSVPFPSNLRDQKLLALKVPLTRHCSDVPANTCFALPVFHSLNRFSLPRSSALSAQILHARLMTKNLSAIFAWRKRFKCARNCTRHLKRMRNCN
jgi:hypothetical protein